MKTFRGRVAAVTGAGSGIGRALARELAARGAHLALADIDEAGLAETVMLGQGSGTKITSQRLDVADRDAVYAWAGQVVADHGRVNLIVNNAGVGLAATVEAMSYEDFEWLMSINFWGVVYGTKAFLPYLKAAGEGHVINLSSVFGLISVPGQAAYNVAKFAVRGFTDALRMELEMNPCGGSGICEAGGSGESGVELPEAVPGQGQGQGEVDRGLGPLDGPVAGGGLVGDGDPDAVAGQALRPGGTPGESIRPAGSRVGADRLPGRVDGSAGEDPGPGLAGEEGDGKREGGAAYESRST